MCGRGRCTLRPDDFYRACYLNSRPVRHLDMDRFRPSYNVAPGFNVPVVRREDGGDGDGVVSQCMKWGLIPSFTKQTEKIDHFKMFNARSESIREKASFRRLLPKNRCLVSFEGFYEWKKDGSKKQPYYVHFKNGRPMVFAALFDSWKSSEGEVLYTFTIITTSSSSALGWLHDRMPVILGSKESTDSWLNDTFNSTLDKILKPYEETDLAWYPVTTAIGKISFDGPECIKEVKIGETKTISQFFSKKNSCGAEEQKLEKTPFKEELQECSVPKSEKEEPESQSTLENTSRNDEAIKKNVMEEPKTDELVGSVVEKSVKAEAESHEESVAYTDDCDAKNKEKCGYVELTGHAKPFSKETDRLHISPAKKQRKGATSKGADDKQPTLFSYIGKN